MNYWSLNDINAPDQDKTIIQYSFFLSMIFLYVMYEREEKNAGVQPLIIITLLFYWKSMDFLEVYDF